VACKAVVCLKASSPSLFAPAALRGTRSNRSRCVRGAAMHLAVMRRTHTSDDRTTYGRRCSWSGRRASQRAYITLPLSETIGSST
jgi:hypothetical protein